MTVANRYEYTPIPSAIVEAVRLAATTGKKALAAFLIAALLVQALPPALPVPTDDDQMPRFVANIGGFTLLTRATRQEWLEWLEELPHPERDAVEMPAVENIVVVSSAAPGTPFIPQYDGSNDIILQHYEMRRRNAVFTGSFSFSTPLPLLQSASTKA